MKDETGALSNTREEPSENVTVTQFRYTEDPNQNLEGSVMNCHLKRVL